MSLPPLNAIRVFEAIGRLGSIKDAASELFVTPGAASRQLARLEQHLGVRLFERSHRQVALTPAGQRYLGSVSDALRALSDATEHLVTTKGRTSLLIWCPMAFGQRWLAPRMASFRALHPERDLTFTTSIGPPERAVGTADVAIRIGRGPWPGYVAHRLLAIELTPVCSPQLLAHVAPLMTPNDLERVTLLQSATRPDYWPRWLAEAGAPASVNPDRGLTFESVSLAFQMALAGAGVAMGQLALVQDDLAAGRLVAPFALRVDSTEAFHLIYPNRLAYDDAVRDFRDWLLGQIEASEEG
ncbi:MAG TPA: LysR substrate-binding domain-containing protein [Ottowia beijingensis]|nr:LysR substrate-binding domain-containing protein [Ottowia beijingensis]